MEKKQKITKVGIVREEVVREVIVLGGNCPGGSCPGGIVQGVIVLETYTSDVCSRHMSVIKVALYERQYVLL